jgi:hypothetical protein
MNKTTLATICLLMLGLTATTAMADVIVVGSSGDLAASAEFKNDGGNLVVILTNTSEADVMAPRQVLTAVFFDMNPLATLIPLSAVLNAGSAVYFGGFDDGGVVGGEWAYKRDLTGAPASAVLGISSSGLGLFGPGDRFPGSNLQGLNGVDGLQYGITSAGDNLETGNAPVIGDNALIQNSVVFTLSGLGNFVPNATNISNVSFQYGTALDRPNVPGTVPDSGVTLMLLGGALAGIESLRRKLRA